MKSHLALLAVYGTFMLIVGCSEASTRALAPSGRRAYGGECDDPSQCEPPRPDDPPPPPPPADGWVEENPCAECIGAPNISDARAAAEIDGTGIIQGVARLEGWGNAYAISMSVSGSRGTQSWTSPTVGDGYGSGLVTTGGTSTTISVASPTATVATGQRCGVIATGVGSFRAEIRIPLTETVWRSASRTVQAPLVFQSPCAGDEERRYDIPTTTGGVKTMKETDQKVCWDRYLITGDSMTYLYTWCE